MGLAMGATVVGLTYSHWGKRSGAHFNPALTWTFYRLGKVAFLDAVGYTLAQLSGGLLGIEIAAWILGAPLVKPPVNYIVTVPGPQGTAMAWLAEMAIAFSLMFMVLLTSNDRRWTRWTGMMAGLLIAIFVAWESPYSGTSLNPARSFASALPAHRWTAFWIYLTAPLGGMLLAAEIYRILPGKRRVFCAKLRHPRDGFCLFRCDYGEL